MKKVILNFAIAVKVILSVSQLAYGGERPASAPPIDERLTGIESRVNGHDTEIAELSKQIDALKLAIKCPCPRGGVCICGEDCVCPNCPKHSKAKATTSQWKPGEPTLKGVEVAFIGTTWCVGCPAAENRLGPLKSQIHHIDADKSQLDERFGISSYPTAVALMDGMVVSRCSGSSIGPLIVGDWLNGKPLAAGAGANTVGGKPSVPAATSDDFIPKLIAKSSPQYSYSRTGYNPVQRCSVTRLGGTRWTWPGNLGSHLSSAHGFNPAGFSHSQLVTIHDNFHNTGRSGVTRNGGTSYATRPAVQYARQTYQPRVYYSSGSYCPNCPR